MPRTILVGYDGSDCAQSALAFAADLAKETGDRITVAFGFHIFPGGGEIGDYRRSLRHHGDEVTDEGVQLAQAAGVSADAEVFEAPPAEGLAELAGKIAARLIVVGSRGEGPIAGALLGSVPHKLLQHSSVPVLVVPEVKT